MPERARPELAPAVHPADDAAARELLRDPVEQRAIVRRAARRRSPSSRASRSSSSGSTAQPQNAWSGTGAVAAAEVRSVGVERGAERAARVARRGRHEHPLEPGLAQDARVGAPVQRHAAAEAEIGEPGLALQRPREIDQQCPRAPAARSRPRRRSARPPASPRSMGSYGRARRAEHLDEARRARAPRRSCGTRSSRGRARTRRRRSARTIARTCSANRGFP